MNIILNIMQGTANNTSEISNNFVTKQKLKYQICILQVVTTEEKMY